MAQSSISFIRKGPIQIAGMTVTNIHAGTSEANANIVSIVTRNLAVNVDANTFTISTGNISVAGSGKITKLGVNIATPDRALEVFDPTLPQLRLTQFDATKYADFQVNANASLLITTANSANSSIVINSLTMPNFMGNTFIPFASGANILSGGTANLTFDGKNLLVAGNVTVANSNLITFVASNITNAYPANSIVYADAVKSFINSNVISMEALRDYQTVVPLIGPMIIIYNVGNGRWESKLPSGDLLMDVDGVYTIQSGVITNTEVSGSAAIARSKLASGTANTIVINSSTGIQTDTASLQFFAANNSVVTNNVMVTNRIGVQTTAPLSGIHLRTTTGDQITNQFSSNTSYNEFRATNDASHSLSMGLTGSQYAGSPTLIAGGPSSRYSFLSVNNSQPLVFGTAGTARLTLTADGALQIPEIASTPTLGSISNQVNMYLKGDKIVFQFNDAGTARYLYISLTGTGVTWTHTTVAP